MVAVAMTPCHGYNRWVSGTKSIVEVHMGGGRIETVVSSMVSVIVLATLN